MMGLDNAMVHTTSSLQLAAQPLNHAGPWAQIKQPPYALDPQVPDGRPSIKEMLLQEGSTGVQIELRQCHAHVIAVPTA